MKLGFTLTALLLPVLLTAQETQKSKIKTMILVDNRAGAQYNEQVARFESQVAASLDNSVLAIISRQETVTAQKIYDGARPTDSTAEANAKLGTSAEALTALRKIVFNAMDPVSGTATTTEDWKTLRNSTALNMARNIGAELILAVAIDSVTSETRSYSGTGVKTKTRITTLRGAYRLLDLADGATIISAPLKASRTTRESDSVQIVLSDICAELMEKAADTLSKDLLAKADTIKTKAMAETVEVWIACTSKDLQGNDLTLPDIRVTDEGKILTTEKPLTVEIAATVELDGMLIGTTPCAVKARPGGIHKLRISAPGFADYSANLNATADTKQLQLTLQMTDSGFKRWQEVRTFLLNLGADKKFVEAALQRDKKLTDAQVEYIKGQAEMYRNSSFRITKLPETLVTGVQGWSIFNLFNR